MKRGGKREQPEQRGYVQRSEGSTVCSWDYAYFIEYRYAELTTNSSSVSLQSVSLDQVTSLVLLLLLIMVCGHSC